MGTPDPKHILTRAPCRTIIWALVMGCLTTVAVAWGLTLWRPVPTQGVIEWTLDEGYESSETTILLERTDFGSLRRLSTPDPKGDWFFAARPIESWSVLERKVKHPNEVVIEDVRGWPFLALRASWEGLSAARGVAERNPLYSELRSSSPLVVRPSFVNSGDFDAWGGARALGTRIIVIGFAGDAIFYATIWYVLIHLGRLFYIVRHWRRFRSNHCVQCGYDLTGGHAARCSECGSVLRENQAGWKPLSRLTRPMLLIFGLVLVVVPLGIVAWQWQRPWTLFEATILNDENAVRAALDRGENVNAKLAARNSATALVFASEQRSSAIAEILLAQGAYIKGDSARSALYSAAKNQNVEMLRALFEAGVGPYLQYGNGLIAFSQVIFYGAGPEVVEVFLEYGAEVDLSAEECRRTPISAAFTARYPNDEVIALLLTRGADVNAKGTSGMTPLLNCAISGGGDASILRLLELGADPNLRNKDGAAPLMWAAVTCEPATVRALVEYGAEIDAVDQYGHSALVYTIQTGGGHPERARVLLELGASLDLIDNDGQTIYDLAANDALREMLRAACAER